MGNNADHQRAWRERQKVKIATLEAALRKEAGQQAASTPKTPSPVTNGSLEARIAELEAQLARADRVFKTTLGDFGALISQRDADLAKARKEIAALQDKLHDGLGARFAPRERKPAKPKTERPPLPPDEERERIIKGLKTRVRNLTTELHVMRQHAEEVQGKTGGMDFRTMSAIAKALHPDHKPSEAEWEAVRDKALKLFTAWKADKDKAHRKGR